MTGVLSINEITENTLLKKGENHFYADIYDVWKI